MRRAQDRNTGLPNDEQATRRTAGVSGPGSASSTATGSTGTTTTTQTTVREQPATATTYARDSRTGYRPEEETRGGGLNTRGTGHGGVLLLLTGLLTFLAGLAAIVKTAFYHVSGLYAYGWHPHSWGWVLFALGIVMFAIGASHLLGIPGSRAAGIVIAVMTAVAAFMWLAFSPVWGFILLALSVLAIWGLLHGAERRGASPL